MLSECSRSEAVYLREIGFLNENLFVPYLLTCKELANRSPVLAMAARILVVVVPIFDPSVRG